MASAARGLSVRRLGRVPYAEALALQAHLQSERIAARVPDTLLLLEHPDVITFGAGAKAEYALTEPELRARGYEVFRTNRGGEVTWHGPGQLVGYPIVDLGARERDVHRYLRELEHALVRALGDLGVGTRQRRGYTGVWTSDRCKIASLGVGVRRWVTMHGFALNVTCDLDRFAAIVPCGLADVEMTSVAKVLGAVDPARVERAVEARMCEAFA